MGKMQKALLKQAADLPKLALSRLLKRKLEEQKIELSSRDFDALLTHLLSGKRENFTCGGSEKDADDKLVKLTFSDSDFAELTKLYDRYVAAIPEVVQGLVEKSSKDLFRARKEGWAIDGAIERYALEEFQNRLEERWSESLQLLRMLLTAVREMGHDSYKRFNRSKAKKYAYRRFVLIRLHIRACQVTDEVISLMENGFADGAMARWRTLHEIGVVAALIGDGDEEMAKRYIYHDAVEVKKQADDYDKTQVPLGYPPIASRERKRIEKDYDCALLQFGKSFGTDYGWAAAHLNIARPTFQQLQAAADQSSMNSYYKLANFHVHAGSRAMFFRLTDMGTNIPIAGRSNAGLVEPGQNTAFTLVRITGAMLLLGRVIDLDRLVELKAIISIRDAIPDAFNRADRRLRRDEAAIQQKLKRDVVRRQNKK